MPNVRVSYSVDTTSLKAGILAGRQFSKRSLPETINSALVHVAADAQTRTPYVRAETIDSELAAKVTAVTGLSGKVLKHKKMFAVSANVMQNGKAVPLAALIIQKLSRQGGSLGKGFPVMGSPFKGVSRSLGAQKMAAYVDKLIKNRHRSTHFLAAGWRDAIDALKAVVKSGIRSQSGIGGQGLGSATPATEGLSVVGEIENNVGAEGPNAESANAALQTWAGPALQAALDHEGKTRLDLALKKMEQGLADAVKPHWG